MITVKDYAKKCHKSVQAVYKQLRSQSNKEKLKGHIVTEETSGKKVMYLDDEAIKILDKASIGDKVIVTNMENTEYITQLERQNSLLKDQLLAAQKEIISLKDKALLLDINKQETETLKKKLDQTDEELKRLKNRSFWQRVMNK